MIRWSEYVRVCLIRNSDTSATFVHMYTFLINEKFVISFLLLRNYIIRNKGARGVLRNESDINEKDI